MAMLNNQRVLSIFIYYFFSHTQSAKKPVSALLCIGPKLFHLLVTLVQEIGFFGGDGGDPIKRQEIGIYPLVIWHSYWKLSIYSEFSH